MIVISIRNVGIRNKTREARDLDNIMQNAIAERRGRIQSEFAHNCRCQYELLQNFSERYKKEAQNRTTLWNTC